jgi:Domain of unknown function (DUF4032)
LLRLSLPFSPRAFAFTRDFGRDIALLNAYNQRRLGLRAVPTAAIIGTVGRTELCAPARMAEFRSTQRYRGIARAMARGDGLPPVDLYLLDGHYYVRDGHHRVTVARELGILDLDARVTECLPAADAPALAWHRARAAFERTTGLTGLHVRRPDGYDLLRAQIAEHAWYLGEREGRPLSFADAAAIWQREIYAPVVYDLARRGVLDRVPDLTATELYLAVCDYKWYRGERLDRDVGFAAAVAGFARQRRHPGLRCLDRLLEAGANLARTLSERALNLIVTV